MEFVFKDLINKVSVPLDKKIKQKDYLKYGKYPIIDQGKDYIGGYTNAQDRLIKVDGFFIVFGDHTCNTKLINFDFAPGADGIKVFGAKEFVHSKFLYYVTSYLTYKLKNKGYGRHFQFIEKMKLNVPVLDEQRKIIEYIEESFSKLDKAEETLLKIKSQLEIYKQAVLKEAFEDFSDGAKVEIDSIVDDIRIGPFGTMLHKEDYVTGGIPVINPQHIKNLKIVPTSNVTISVEKAEELNSYRLRPNDIIMGRRGQMGRTAHITENEDGWICGTGSITFRMKKEFSAEFYAKVLSSPEVVRYLEENATGTTMKNLNEKIVKHIPVPYLTRKQQDALIGELDYKISICTNTNKCIDVTLLKLKSLRQSILKEAFEGKLV